MASTSSRFVLQATDFKRVKDDRHLYRGRLEARLAIHAGDFERAYKLLRKAHRGGTGSTEGLLLFAIAARETEKTEVFETAIEAAQEKGADVTALYKSASSS